MGYVVPEVYKHEIEDLGLDVRPSKHRHHESSLELDDAARKGTIEVDGSIVLRSQPLRNVDGSPSDAEPGIEVNVGKAAVEPVWYLPGMAERFEM